METVTITEPLQINIPPETITITDTVTVQVPGIVAGGGLESRDRAADPGGTR